MHQRSFRRTHAQRLTLAAHPAAVPGVRRLACEVLRGWGLDDLSDDAALLVSELVTNAVRASAAGCGRPGDKAQITHQITLTLSLTGTGLVIEVRDVRPDPAALLCPDNTTETGRGLLIVEALASKWGQRSVHGGKVVWCELPLQAAAAPAARPLAAAASF